MYSVKSKCGEIYQLINFPLINLLYPNNYYPFNLNLLYLLP